MERRKFLIGAGSLAAAGVAGLGTGAFTSASADRNADIVVRGDAGSFLSLAPCNGPNADKYVDYSGGTLSLELDEDSEGPGNGFNQNSNYRIKDLFKIQNQGSQPVTVHINGADSGDAGKRLKWVNENGGGDGATNGSVDGTTIGVGEMIKVGLDLQLRGNDVGDVIADEVTIRADAAGGT